MPRFDVIVVGAGPAGASAAYAAAKKGLKTLLVERGRGAGSKQMYGGRVYAHLLRKIYGDLDKSAPVERWVRKERVSLVSGGQMVTVDYESDRAVSFTAYLTRLASWMVDKATEAGAIFVDEVRVDRLLVDGDGRVYGIEAGLDRAEASVVVDAEGVNRLLLEKLGLAERTRPDQVAVGVKEVIKIGEKQVEERFNLGPGEGLSWVLMGSVTDWLPGGAFIYTNKDTVSVGLVVFLGASPMAKKPVHRMMEELRLHPSLRRLWAGGDIIEYSARLTPESGYKYVPRSLVSNGLMVAGDAAGLLLSTGYTFRGVDYAAYSGYLAGEAAAKAIEEGDTSSDNLKRLYEDKLKSTIIPELEKHRGVEYVMSTPDFFKLYPALAAKLASRLFDLEEEAPSLLEALVESAAEAGAPLSKAIVDLLWLVRRL